MRHWDLPITEKKPKDLQIGEATPHYSDGKYSGFRVGRDKHGWFAFIGKCRTPSKPDVSLIYPQTLRNIRKKLAVEGKG